MQKSVFECQVGQTEWVAFRDRLLRQIKPEQDSLRFYFPDGTAAHGEGVILTFYLPTGMRGNPRAPWWSPLSVKACAR